MALFQNKLAAGAITRMVTPVPHLSTRHACPTARRVQAVVGRSIPASPVICRAASTLQRTVDAGSNPFELPLPIVKIDNVSDAFASVLTVEYGVEVLGELLEMVTALKNLDLNITRAKLPLNSGPSPRNVFFITDVHTSEKISHPKRLEDIRMVVIECLVATYPETAFSLASTSGSGSSTDGGGTDGRRSHLGQVRVVVPTTVDIDETSNGICSVLKIATPDRPGLLMDIVRTLKDINVNVVSAEIDTIGLWAKDEFFVTYRGEPLNGAMVQLVTNALQYHLSFTELAREQSY